MSVSTLMMFSGAATPSRVVNLSIGCSGLTDSSNWNCPVS
jgi:hypothetical protein